MGHKLERPRRHLSTDIGSWTQGYEPMLSITRPKPGALGTGSRREEHRSRTGNDRGLTLLLPGLRSRQEEMHLQ